MSATANLTTFLYFAYGSNLLAQRIHINNPSAVRVGIGKLLDYQLDFVTFSKRWQGAAATIYPKPGRHVWGAIWELNIEHMASLDRQEGVSDNIYFARDVDVVLPASEGSEGGNTTTTKKCRVYEQCVRAGITENLADLAFVRKPSQVYLDTIIRGARESGLPLEYRDFLQKIPHNGYDGHVDLGTDLKLVDIIQRE